MNTTTNTAAVIYMKVLRNAVFHYAMTVELVTGETIESVVTRDYDATLAEWAARGIIASDDDFRNALDRPGSQFCPATIV